MSNDQLEVLAILSEKVHTVYLGLRSSETDYLLALEEHSIAREKLARLIDNAYDEGDVIGKNEREREAHLRRLLPAEHNEVLRLEAMVRGAERLMRGNQRDAERLALQVQIARMVYDLQQHDEVRIKIFGVSETEPLRPFRLYGIGGGDSG